MMRIKTTTLVILIVSLVVSVGRFGLDSFLPSMPFIVENLNINFQDVEWALSLYLFGLSISQLIYGPLSDRIGRKPVLVLGFFLFILGSTLCWCAEGLFFLLFGRLLGGLGMGVGPSLKRAILADMFEGTSLTKAAALVSNALVITLIFAPVVGGYIQQYFSWRENFLFPALYAAFVLGAIVLFFKETNMDKLRSSFKIESIVFDYQLHLRRREFIGFSLCSAIAFSLMMLYFQSSSFVLIQHFQLSPSDYGWISLLVALTYLSGGFLVTILSKSYTNQTLIQIGFLMMSLSSLLFLLLNAFYPPHLLSYLFPILLSFVAARIIIPCSLSGAMSKSQASGAASSLMGGIQMSFTAFVSFLYSYVDKENFIAFGFFFLLLAIGGGISGFWCRLSKMREKRVEL